MTLKLKDIFIMTLVFITSYIIVPLFVVYYSDENNLAIYGFFIILMLVFLSFSSNLIYTYFKGKYIIIPLLSVIISISLIWVLNPTATFLVLLIAIFSFIGYFLGTIFSKKN